ncbi:uncharacterized protein B0H64DRAFT_76527 [Chaetomium fimeti]|uniref:Uncharacterized protein n=1 Tax=Chaetomium fimeti TaxID=1854472 RepID=A0AAE0HL19_9PEZI|nr:hypothetical protein B0H64DRAFT_76527 [Chaetomium fimeti]
MVVLKEEGGWMAVIMSDDGGRASGAGGCIALHGGVLAVIFSLFLPLYLCLSRAVLITALRWGLHLLSRLWIYGSRIPFCYLLICIMCHFLLSGMW